MPDKEFLENYPLYKKFEKEFRDGSYFWDLESLPKPAIHLYCEGCKSDQTFCMVNNYWELRKSREESAEGIVRAQYVCSACQATQKLFFIKLNRITKSEKIFLQMMKVGQWPSWLVETDKELEKILGEYKDYYKKGLICESENYGIGAYAYFRHIVDDIIDELLKSILDLIEIESDKNIYKVALEKVSNEHVTEKKIELVKDLLPLSLRPDGTNPLQVLYNELSGGLHDGTDDECMKKAETVRTILTYLINQVIKTRDDKKLFTESMRKILAK